MSGEAKPAALVIAPMPVFPTNAGNRQRLLATCEMLKRGGYAIDFAYLAHEDQIYRRFGQHPPTDDAAARAFFRRVFRITPVAAVPLRTKSRDFGIDDWCPPELDDFVAWYSVHHRDTRVVLVNYVFLSRCLERVPPGVMRIIDTHDRFTDRHRQYIPFRSEPNFFHTDAVGESQGLSRSDLVLAIREDEARFFRSICPVPVQTLPPRACARRLFETPHRLGHVGFIGHGNDANLFSISRFITLWSQVESPMRPELVVAGEICRSLPPPPPGVRHLGYVEEPKDFYAAVDAVVAPMIAGTGLKMKILEALSFGTPVLGTRMGFEGFDTVAPQHHFTGLPELIDGLLAISDDPAALQSLTTACTDLLDRYGAAADTEEQAFLARLPKAPSSEPPHRPDGSAREVLAGESFILSGENSVRSSPLEDEEHGQLVATERRPGGREAQAGYTAARRRWFVRERRAGDPPPSGTNPFYGRAVAPSPEWVRTDRLSSDLRERTASLLLEGEMDWVSEGAWVGAMGRSTVVVTRFPADLIHHPSWASFLILPAGEKGATELRFRSATCLAGPPLAFTNRSGRYALTARTVALTLTPARMVDPSRADGAALLVIADDLMGRIDLGQS